MPVFAFGLALAVVLSFLAHQFARFPGDLALALWLQSQRSPLLDLLMSSVTTLGFFWPAASIALAATLVLTLAGLRLESWFTIASLSSFLLNATLKIVVGRPRPDELVVAFPEASPYGFPSGHVMHFVALYGFLLYVAWTRLPPSRWRTAALGVLALLLILIGPSRVYLGAHWPSDVAVGYLIGALWLAVIAKIYTAVRDRLLSAPPVPRSNK